jgi:hypothetical protein
VIAVLAVLVPALAASGAPTVLAPPADARVDYQIGGAYAPPAGTTVVSRDRHDQPEPGIYNLCYVNAFQTQDEDLARVWKQHVDLLLARPGVDVPADADPTVRRDVERYWVSDAAWDEILLDISTEAKRTALAAIVGDWIDGCARVGFRAVEPDNLDSWTRNRAAQRQLTRDDAVAYARLLAARAHGDGLAIAQKNAPQLAALRTATGFDFAVAEECTRYDECDAYTRHYDDHVIVIEYRRRDFTRACADPAIGPSLSVVFRNRDVRTSASRGFVDEAC